MYYANEDHMLRTVYCTDAFGLNTEFKFEEFVSIN